MVTTRMELERKREIELRYRYSSLAFEANGLLDEIEEISKKLLEQMGAWIKEKRSLKAENVQKAIKQLLNADIVIKRFKKELKDYEREIGEGIRTKNIVSIRRAISGLSLELNEVNRQEKILNRIKELQTLWKGLNIKWNVLMDQLTEMEKEASGQEKTESIFLAAKKMLAA